MTIERFPFKGDWVEKDLYWERRYLRKYVCLLHMAIDAKAGGWRLLEVERSPGPDRLSVANHW